MDQLILFPKRPRVLSYGGGLDSFAMLLGAVQRGDKPDACVFCDVSNGIDPGEWPGTYKHIREVAMPLCAREGIEFVWMNTTDYPVRDAPSLFGWLKARGQIPVSGPNRICTIVAKVERFERWMDDRFPDQLVEVWVGFEAGEEKRAASDPNAGKPRKLRPGRARRVNRFPLMEWGLCRCRAEQLVRVAGYPVPRKSACSFCLAGDTEVVTRYGIRPIRDLAGGQHRLLVPQVGKLGGLMHRGAFKEVEVRSFGVQPLWEVKLRRCKSTKIVRTTAEHRWFVTAGKQWAPMSTYERTTATLVPGDRLRLLRAPGILKENIMGVAVAQGFTFGDGSHSLKAGNDRPASSPLHGAKDAALLPFFSPSDLRQVAASKTAKAHQAIYGLPRFWKKPPPLDESRAFLLSWLAGYFAADGSVSKAGQAVLESASLEAVKVARSIAAICGVGYSRIHTKKRKGFLKEPGEMFKFSLRLADLPPWFFIIEEHRRRVNAIKRATHDQPWVVESVRELGVVEEVFCAIVPGAGAFGLAEDLMTGNCPYGTRGDWQTLARELPAEFAAAVELEAAKPPTSNGKKLSIMGYRTTKNKLGEVTGYVAPPLPEYIAKPYTPKPMPCGVCGAEQRASKATGCDYLAA